MRTDRKFEKGRKAEARMAQLREGLARERVSARRKRELQGELADLEKECELHSECLVIPVNRVPLRGARYDVCLRETSLRAVQAMHTASDREKELILRLESDLTEARIHVIDTGPGVPEDMRESIFHPYVSGSPGGSGLGLPTTRRIAEEHGGSVSLEVLQGRGSDFIIHLPRTDTQDEQQA